VLYDPAWIYSSEDDGLVHVEINRHVHQKSIVKDGVSLNTTIYLMPSEVDDMLTELEGIQKRAWDSVNEKQEELLEESDKKK